MTSSPVPVTPPSGVPVGPRDPAAKSDGPGKSEWPGKPDGPGKSEWPGKPDGPGKPGKPWKTDIPRKSAKKSKRKLVVVTAVVAALAAGGIVMKAGVGAVVYKPGEPVPPGQVVTLGTLTVDTSDGQLVQATLDLQLTKPADVKAEAADGPELINAAIADIGGWTDAELITSAGRAALQRQLLGSFQRILGTVDGAAQQVSAVYFTSFVLQ